MFPEGIMSKVDRFNRVCSISNHRYEGAFVGNFTVRFACTNTIMTADIQTTIRDYILKELLPAKIWELTETTPLISVAFIEEWYAITCTNRVPGFPPLS